MNTFVIACLAPLSLAYGPPVNVIIYQSTPLTYLLSGTPAPTTPVANSLISSFAWYLTVSTTLNQDNGNQNMRWVHTLNTPIMATDVVMFEIDFIAGWENEVDGSGTSAYNRL